MLASTVFEDAHASVFLAGNNESENCKEGTGYMLDTRKQTKE